MSDDVEIGGEEQSPAEQIIEVSRDLSFLHDVTLQVTVEFGRAGSTVGSVLNLSPGHVLQLERQADEPVTIRVNNNIVARGEIVVVNDKYGVRVTEIIDPRGLEALNAKDDV